MDQASSEWTLFVGLAWRPWWCPFIWRHSQLVAHRSGTEEEVLAELAGVFPQQRATWRKRRTVVLNRETER